MKNKKKNNIDVKTIILLITIVFSCINLYATSQYLYDSKDIKYENTSTLTSATDVQTAVDDLLTIASRYELTAGNADFHNIIFRGKDVTEYLSSEYSLYDRIADGTFTDLYVGDYVVLNEITWRIAGFDIYYGKGDSTDTSINQTYNRHHAVIVPDTNLTTAYMHSSNNAKIGYIGSTMYTATLPSVLSTYIKPLFGDHVLKYRNLLVKTANTGNCNRLGACSGTSNAWGWYTRELDLMNENQIFGSIIWSSSGFDTGSDNIQFPLFRLKPEYIDKSRSWYWLRCVANKTQFVNVGNMTSILSGGFSSFANAKTLGGVRPYFYIG